MGTIQLWLSILGLVVVSGGTYAYLKHRSEQRAPAARELASSPTPPAGQAPKSEERPAGKFNPFDYHFKPGLAFEVAFKREISGEAQKEKKAMTQFAESKIAGNVVFNSVKYEDSTVYVVAQFFIKTLTSPLVDFSIAYEFGVLKGPGDDKKAAPAVKPGEPAAAQAVLPAKFKNAILLELAASGRIRRVLRTSPGMSDAGVSLMSEAVQAMLYRWPEENPPKKGGKVTREERDETGRKFKIEYEYTNAPAGELIIKGLAVVDPPPKDKDKSTLEETIFTARSHKEVSCTWDKALGVPKTLNWSISQEVRAKNERLISAAASVSSTWKDAGSSRFSVEDLAKFSQVVDLEAIKRKRMARAAADPKHAKDAKMDWNKARGGLGSVDSPGMGEEARGAFFNDFAEVLKDNPALTDEYVNEAKRYPPGSRQVNMVLGALGYVGTEDAQKAMMDLYARPGAADSEKEKVLISMVLSPQPLIAESKDFLQQIYRGPDPDRSQQAGYALGASINKDPDPELVKQFKQEFGAAGGDVDRKVYLLQVMGNDKGTEFRPQIMSAYGSSDPELRAAAIDSLRFARDEDGRNSLLQAIPREQEPAVRNVAYHALQYQPYDTRTRDALASCVGSEPDDSIRSTCYDVLLSHMQDPGTRDILAGRVNSETSEPIKFKLKNALGL